MSDLTNEKVNEVIAANLRRILQEKRISQKELARRCNISEARMCLLINLKRSFKVGDLVKFTQVLKGVEAKDLLKGI
jgi:transcriptional regulator with XRE-family HTH domain